MGNLHEFGRPDPSQFSQVEKQGPAFPEDLYEKGRVPQRAVEQLSVKKRFQGSSTGYAPHQASSGLKRLLRSIP
jgi:hypothetical protein